MVKLYVRMNHKAPSEPLTHPLEVPMTKRFWFTALAMFIFSMLTDFLLHGLVHMAGLGMCVGWAYR